MRDAVHLSPPVHAKAHGRPPRPSAGAAPVAAGGEDLNELLVDEFTTDKAFYAALKLHVHATVHDGLLAALLAGRSLVVDQAVRLEVGRFTARKANHLFVAEQGPPGSASSEFYGFTSHKVREKLSHLHGSGVVELVGRGLREAFTYRWKEPVRHWEVCSFLRFRARTADDLMANLDLYRIHQAWGAGAFTPKQLVDAYARAHGAEYAASRWGRRKWERIAASFAYAETIRARLDRLVHRGHVLADGERHRLDPSLRDAMVHFDLFLNGPAYRASREMCAACPLDALCQAGSTQRLLGALNGA